MRAASAMLFLGCVIACSSSTTTTETTRTNVCCINGQFYDCESGCSTKCDRDSSRNDECGGESSSSSSSSSGSSSSSSSSSSGGGTAKKRGDACECDPDPGYPDDVYAECTGNVTGCNTLELSCLYKSKTGEGVCVVNCSKSEVGVEGACPTGLTCLPSGKKDGSGSEWHACQ